MVCVIFLHFGGSVNEQFKLVDMRPHMLTESASRPLVDFGVLNDNLIK
jgi:hypothetical protein